MDFKDLMDGYESVSRDFPLPIFHFILHGKMKPADKDAVEMVKRFSMGKLVMVATISTVGVNVP
jgi:ATP-dependent DNA helicase RecG